MKLFRAEQESRICFFRPTKGSASELNGSFGEVISMY